MATELPPYLQNIHNPFPVLKEGAPDLRRQGFEVPNTRKPGSTGHYRNARFPDMPGPDSRPDFPKTTYDIFNFGLARSYNKPCFGYRPINPLTGDFERHYVWQTYSEIDQRRTDFGSGLVKLQQDGLVGTSDRAGWKVGLWTHNRPEWQIATKAAAAYSLVSLSLYDTLGPDVVQYCITHAEARVIVASAAHIPALLALVSKCPTMKVIVSADVWKDVDGVPSKMISTAPQSKVFKKWGADLGVHILDFAEVEAMGAANRLPHAPPLADDLASLCYTSGTTGNPKAAVVNHRTMAAAVISNLHSDQIYDDDLHISYLPLSHCYEQFVEEACLACGIPIGFACGDNLRLLEDLQILKPTRFVSVPRVLNRLYQAVNAQIEGSTGLKGTLAKKALAAKLGYLKTDKTYEHALWDRLVFKKVKSALGGRVRMIGSGSAPIAPEVLSFLKVAFVSTVTEGYGSTENTGTCSRCLREDHDPNGTVGPPQVGVEIKLMDVPDMNYFSTDKPYPRGEICVRGQGCIPGYYKDDKKTAELIDADGWQHSGDVGMIDEKGRLKIIDRIKNLLKLSQGEYVAVEKVEGVYSLCPLIAQIYVHGDSLQSHLIGVVVPNPDTFAPFASKVSGKTVSPTDMSGLDAACKDPRVVTAFLKEMEKESKRARLNGFETTKQLLLTTEAFTSDNDLLTPTMKLKRPQAKNKYKAEMDKLYAIHSSGAPKPKL